jgi:hypothetical protein
MDLYRGRVLPPYFYPILSVLTLYLRNEREKKLNLLKKAAGTIDRKVVFSTLWIFATLNYIYADIFSLYFLPGAQKETLTMTSGAVLGFAFLMETSIAMVLLSRFLKYGANRWLNVIIGVVHTAAVAWSLSGDAPAPYYIMFASIEIACTLFIIGYALWWRRPQAV